MTGPIIVPLDLEGWSDRALAPAARLARALGVGLHLVVIDGPGLPTEADKRRLLERAALYPGMNVTHEVVLSVDPVDETLRAVVEREGASMVCLATRGRGLPVRLLVDSVSLDLVGRAPVPIVLVGPHAVDRAGPVLAAIDGGEHDRDVLAAALDFAVALGARVEMVHATGRRARGAAAGLTRLHNDGIDDEGSVAEPAIDLEIEAGSPAAVIAQAAVEANAGLVVLGPTTHVLTGRGGPVPGRVVRRATCPVLVLPLAESVLDSPRATLISERR